MKSIASVPNRRSRRQPAFTLIELLVVVVIIGALAGLMFPMLRSMRSRADITKCTSNLRTWAVVIRGYAGDNNQMVRYEEWPDIGANKRYYNSYFPSEKVMWPETGKMGYSLGYHRMCPAQDWDGVGSRPTGYIFTRPNEFNGATGRYVRGEFDSDRDGKPDSYSLARVARPSQLLMMMDATEDQNIYRTSELVTYVKPVCINSDKSKIRHGGGVNALFADGHVDFLKWDEINPDNSANTQKATTWLNLD